LAHHFVLFVLVSVGQGKVLPSSQPEQC